MVIVCCSQINIARTLETGDRSLCTLPLRIGCRAIAASILGLAPLAAAATPTTVTLQNPGIRLWHLESGTLSDNIAAIPGYSLWNTIAASDERGGPADDALFTIEVHNPGKEYVPGPLILTATNAKGKVLARNVYRRSFNGNTATQTAPLWVYNLGCAGPVTFTATLGKIRESTELVFACGE